LFSKNTFLQVIVKKFIPVVPSFQSKLVLKRTLIDITVFIEATECIEIFRLPLEIKAKEAIEFIQVNQLKSAVYDPTRTLDNPPLVQHDLILVPPDNIKESSARGICLDLFRTLQSYKLTPSDTLVLTKGLKLENDRWKIQPKGNDDAVEILVIVSSQEFGTQKTLRVSTGKTFGDVLKLFLTKTKLRALPYFYGLYLTHSKAEFIEELMDPTATLESYPLPVPAKFEFKARKRPAMSHFETDPSILPTVSHWGLDIPEILYVLYQLLELCDGFTAEGIFRVAGEQAEMLQFINNFDKGLPVYSDNVHCIATLLKRWYKSLPRRIFATVDKDKLKNNLSSARTIHRTLPSLEHALTTWLIEVLLQVSKHQETNHMTPDNLGIVFGPGVFGSTEEELNMSPLMMMQSIEDCKLGKDVIREIVQYYLEHPDQRPLLDKAKTVAIHNKMTPAIMMTFKQSSSLGRILLKRKEMLPDHISEEKRLEAINSPQVKETKTKKEEKKRQTTPPGGLAFQKELQKQFVNGTASVLTNGKKPKKKKSKFSTLRGMMKGAVEKERQSAGSEPATPSNKSKSKNSRNARRSDRKLASTQPLKPALRRSDSDLTALVKTLRNTDTPRLAIGSARNHPKEI